ncbi:MAG: SH3 domain-containing protein [Planctomycetota bacterium]
MRSFRALLTFVGLAGVVHALWGQAPMQPVSPYPAATTVSAAQADVYSGPGATFYPTTRLRQGERVVVLGESKKAPGWYEIVPPPTSFSWIDAKYVKTVPGVEKIGIVDTGDSKGTAPIMPGSALVNKEPNVEITRVATGTQLLLLDRPTTSGTNTWYPIAPVATEVRFLQADALRSGGGGGYAGYNNNTYNNNGFQVPTVPTGFNNSGTMPVGGWQPTAGPVAPTNNFVQLSQQGDQALAAGNMDRARLLYVEALSQTNDPAWRNYLSGQIQRTQTAAIPTQPPINTGSSPLGSAPIGALPPPPGAAAPAAKQWSPWGVLRTAPFTSRDGQPMYVLENRQNAQPLMYVTTSTGMSLRDYLGQTVAIYGGITARNDDYIRAQIIVAEQVATPPNGAK